MKRSNSTYVVLAVLAIIVAGFYAVNFKADKASVFSLPNFNATTHVPPSSNQPINSLKDLNNAFVKIAQQTNPTVVTIRVKQTVKVKQPQNPFFRFFGGPGQGGGPPQTEERRGLGSGVIVSKDGYILTNNHVVHNADKIEVTLNNNKEYKGKVVGTDPLTDLAVVKIDAKNLQAIKMGNSDSLKVGSLVLAIGSPEALSHTVTMGIVSAKHRHINLIEHGKGFENYIQTDAAINPGNSGGAMVNMDGELVGINAAIETQSGGNEGIGFAVPINLARSVMKSIIKNGKVTHAELGVQVKNINQAMAQSFGLKNDQGILINDVAPNTAADRAGLKQGDVIKTMNGNPVGNIENFRTTIGTSKPGTKVTLGIVRNGKHMNVQVTLGKLKQQQGASSQNSSENIQKRLGFSVQELTPRIARQLNLNSNQQGVVVTNVKRGSKAEQNGLKQGDVITHINKKTIKNMDDFKSAIDKLAKEKNPNILLQVINRQGMNEYIAYSL